LGFSITPEGVKPLHKRVVEINTREVDRTQTGVMSFLGLVNYYKGFVPKLSEIAEPLTRLLRKGADVSAEWGEAQDLAVQRVKRAFSDDTVLTKFDLSRRILLQTDASDIALGAVISHYKIDEGGKRIESPICFASKKLNCDQRNYSVTEKEGLAVLWAVEHFRTMLLGRYFLLETDHSALRSILTTRNPEGRLARWVLKLQEFDFEVAYRKGKDHVPPDFMSRNWAPKDCFEPSVPAPVHPSVVDDGMVSTGVEIGQLKLKYPPGMTPERANRLLQTLWDRQVWEDLENEYVIKTSDGSDAETPVGAQRLTAAVTVEYGNTEGSMVDQEDVTMLPRVCSCGEVSGVAFGGSASPRKTSQDSDHVSAMLSCWEAKEEPALRQETTPNMPIGTRPPTWYNEDPDITALDRHSRGLPPFLTKENRPEQVVRQRWFNWIKGRARRDDSGTWYVEQSRHLPGGHVDVRRRMVVPMAGRREVIERVHGGAGSGHLNFLQTVAQLEHNYTWPGMRSQVRSYCELGTLEFGI
jgi:hypothetical protein